jgi:hypothetical protein
MCESLIIGLIEILSRLYYVCIDSCSILVTRKILQSMSWWIFYVGIPYSTWHWNVLGSQNHHLLSGRDDKL